MELENSGQECKCSLTERRRRIFWNNYSLFKLWWRYLKIKW
jgi:hypothetical protein